MKLPKTEETAVAVVTEPRTEDRHGIPAEVLDALLKDAGKPGDLTGPEGLLKRLTAALVERVLDAELTEHLGYPKHGSDETGAGNARNGHSKKRLRSEQGPLDIAVPRDRGGSFSPQLVKKHDRTFNGFDDKIVALYARGMSVADIQGHLKELYGTEVSPELISRATDAVLDELRAWQGRPLEAIYAVVYLDALVVKVRDGGTVQNKAAYLAIGVTLEGRREVLGMWFAANEGAKFWLSVITELKNRGVEDLFIVCCDGLKGFPEAIEAVFPKAIVQTCIVHVIRGSLRFVPYGSRKAVAADLRRIYAADTEENAVAALGEFEEKWSKRYPTIAPAWRANWERIRPFLAFPKEVRKLVYTTNAIESLNFQLRKVLKTKGHFPSEEAVAKLMYLALRNIEAKWKRPPIFWTNALSYFAVLFADRIPA
jgi:putative transposase